MKDSEMKLPSNRKFGFFFTVVFAVFAAYFCYSDNSNLAYAFTLGTALFLLITLINSTALLPFNYLWMRLGLVLGMVTSPIVLGVLFFLLFTPIAILMRLSGRDELNLKPIQKVSYWIARDERIISESFKNQF